MIKKILLGIINFISVLLIVASVCVLLTVVLTKKGEAPNLFGYTFFRVMTGSMEPQIPVDSFIVVKHVDPESLKENDIISFYSKDPSLQGAVNTHRIVRIEKDAQGKGTFITKGDANNIEDRYGTPFGNVIGKVIFSSTGVGKFVRLVSNPLIFVPLVIIPLFIMLIKSLVQSISAAKKIAQQEEEEAVREAIEKIRREKKQGE